jgi:hypothetical protein
MTGKNASNNEHNAREKVSWRDAIFFLESLIFSLHVNRKDEKRTTIPSLVTCFFAHFSASSESDLPPGGGLFGVCR